MNSALWFQLCAVSCSVLVLPIFANGQSAATWKMIRSDISDYRLLAVLKTASRIGCLTSSEAAEAHVVSFDAASGECALLVCDRGSADGCKKCRHARDPSLPVLWFKEPSENCWQTFQHRVDGSVSFNRNWSEYTNGFGQGESLNYWMGLERLHQVTQTGVWRVRWEFSDWNGTWYWAENAPFSVGAAADKYRASMGPLDASRSNVAQIAVSDWTPDNRQFSTPEADNDAWTGGNCAQSLSAGWWFGKCQFMNPNGVYLVPPEALSNKGIYYIVNGPVLKEYYSMKSYESMIRQ